jgi:hypothetical protein
MLQETKNIIPPYKFRKQQIELHTEQSSETLLPTVRSQFHSKTLVGVHEKLSKQNNTEIKRMILYRVGACAEVHQVPEILRLPHALAQRVGAVHLPDLDDALRAELDALRRAPGRLWSIPSRSTEVPMGVRRARGAPRCTAASTTTWSAAGLEPSLAARNANAPLAHAG